MWSEAHRPAGKRNHQLLLEKRRLMTVQGVGANVSVAAPEALVDGSPGSID